MKKLNSHSNENGAEPMTTWYRYAADQPGFVGYALRSLRERTGTSTDDQQRAFGVGDAEFLRLQAMTMPRAESFARDAHRIAESCQVTNTLAFVRAITTARQTQNTSSQNVEQGFYQAAFDAQDDLDTVETKE